MSSRRAAALCAWMAGSIRWGEAVAERQGLFINIIDFLVGSVGLWLSVYKKDFF